MSMSLELQLCLEKKLYFSNELGVASRDAADTNGKIYSWKTIGKDNWLEGYISIVDTLGYVVLPKGLPHYIEMPEDCDDD